jgi:hypothetical protein
MKVSNAIKMLSVNFDQDEEICISVWARDLFIEEDTDELVSEELWGYAVQDFNKEQGYDLVNECVSESLWNAMDEARKETNQ